MAESPRLVTRYSGPPVTVSFNYGGSDGGHSATYWLSHWTGEENYRNGTTWRLPWPVPEGAFDNGPLTVSIESGHRHSLGTTTSACVRIGQARRHGHSLHRHAGRGHAVPDLTPGNRSRMDVRILDN